DVMRADFAANFHAARPSFTKQPYTACSRDVLAMNVMIAKFRQQNIPHHYRFFAGWRPAGQPKQRAPLTLMYHSVADQTVILTMIEYRHANHAGIFDGAPHEFVILNAMTVIRYRHNPCLCQ